MGLFIGLIFFVLLLVVLPILLLVGRVLGGVVSLFGVKNLFRSFSSHQATENRAEEEATHFARSTVGVKRVQRLREMAETVEFEEILTEE